MSWISFLDNNEKSCPEKFAIVEQKSGTRLSFRELNNKTKQWAFWLCEKGVKKGDVVCFLSTNSKEHLLLLFACSKLGAILSPLNFRLSKRELEDQVAFSHSKLTLTTSEFTDSIEKSVNIENIHLSEESFEEDYSNNKNPVLMLFTSGSTGQPKGVLFHGEMILKNNLMTSREWGLLTEDITLVETPFFHTGGYNVLCLPLLSIGGQVIIAEKFEPQNVIDTWNRYKVTVYFGVPTMFQSILSQGVNTDDVNSLRFCVSGGASISKETIIKFQNLGVMFKQGFGLTEVGPNCFILDSHEALRKQGSIGKPMPHSMTKVLSKDLKEVSANEPGELLIKGEHLCLGYYKNENLFKDSLDSEGYFKTGDLVKYDSEGFFYVVGRIKDMYISGGENVYPGEVERVINDHPSINESIVISSPDKKWGEVGKLIYTSEIELPIETIHFFLSGKLAKYKWPKKLERISGFPLLPNGKIDKVQVRAGAIR
ncbi:MAG: AMP-binding protein [Bacteriovoracaceae bacterium]|nr:AMP-binding protein [Bacteriovoracaceae bacterium]